MEAAKAGWIGSAASIMAAINRAVKNLCEFEE
jgi:hypothetical protein